MLANISHILLLISLQKYEKLVKYLTSCNRHRAIITVVLVMKHKQSPEGFRPEKTTKLTLFMKGNPVEHQCLTAFNCKCKPV